MLRLSIIVPFYNVEKYIEQCICSLYNQDIPWGEYEVICIDDCSPDGSRAIVERLQQEYPTLKLLRTPENLRQGGARNMGLDIAQGKYIWFVDSDDYIEPNCLAELLKIIEDNALEVLHFDYQELIGKNIIPYQIPDKNESINIGLDYFIDSRRAFWGTRCAEVWRRIQLRSFLENHRLTFIEHQRYEDTDFSIRLFGCAQRLKHINQSPYIYRKNMVSTTHEPLLVELIVDKISLLCRCVLSVLDSSGVKMMELVGMYIRSQSTVLREEISHLSCEDKCVFRRKMFFMNLRCLYPYMSFRTWLTLKFGICLKKL